MTRLMTRELLTLVVVRLCARRALQDADLDGFMRTLTPKKCTYIDPRKPEDVLDDLRRVERWIGKIPILSNTCLDRSIARYAALRQAGVDVKFCVGVRPASADGGVEGHAWLELDDVPFGEDLPLASLPHGASIPYTTTYSFPERRST